MAPFASLLGAILAFALAFASTAVPPLDLGSLIQSGAALASLNFSGTPMVAPTQLPAAEATAIASSRFPHRYFVPFTNPQIVLQISPNRQIPITPYAATYAIVHGLNVLVEYTISYRGDHNIAGTGIRFGAVGVYVDIKSHLPGHGQDITLRQTSHILRGLWEVLAAYGSFTMDAQIYIGGLGLAQYKGTAVIFLGYVSSNATEDVLASAITDTAKART